jgi:biotin-dependent carboxylase-like uncharacterized protein
MLEVIEPGLLTTVQDLGRPDAVHLGVPVGGACDSWSLRAANALVGNEPQAAALELTLAGPTLAVRAGCWVGLAGTDLGARLLPDEVAFEPGTSRLLRAGQTLAFDVAGGRAGVRAYLALAGGVDVPQVLGSRSTCLVGGFGGLAGRALVSGDLVRAGASSVAGRARSWPAAGPQPPIEAGRRPLRVLPGPHPARFADDSLQRLTSSGYRVSPRADRQAIFLDGEPIFVADGGGPLLSHGVVWGAIQLPPDGRPICLLADHHTVGGYPVLAVVISADLPLLGQLGPADPVTFELVNVDAAQAALRDQALAFERAIVQLDGGA